MSLPSLSIKINRDFLNIILSLVETLKKYFKLKVLAADHFGLAISFERR